jgi:monoamine oxidase
MSRTPLFREIRRALGRARLMNATGLPALDVVELTSRDRAVSLRSSSLSPVPYAVVEAGSPGETGESAPAVLAGLGVDRVSPLTRRRFVGLSAMGVTGIVSGCSVAGLSGGGGAGGDDPVIIVGAGIAGLTAAYRLRQAGVPCRVFDAQNRVGGRMLSLRNFFADGQVCELGGELIDTPHTSIRALAQELGIALDDLSVEPPGLAMETLYFGGAKRSEVELVEAFGPVAARMAAATSAVGEEPTMRDPAGAAALDTESIAEWLDRSSVTGWVRDLLRVAYTTEYGLEIDQQSSLNLLLMIESDPFRVFGESDERFHVRGGNDLITGGLAGRVQDAIETTTVLEAVSLRPDGRYACTFARNSGTFDVTASDVILAIPFTLLREVRLDVDLPAVKRKAIDELGYGTNAKLMIGFGGRVWRERHASNGSTFSDLPFQLVWETSRAQPGKAGILTNFTGGDHGVEIGTGSASARAAEVVLDLERVYPGIAADRMGMREVRMHWPTHPWVRGSYAGYKVGQWTTIRGVEGEAVGRLRFAGEHCSLRAQGFMEGGCETGERAAREVLAARGVRVGFVSRRALMSRLSATAPVSR